MFGTAMKPSVKVMSGLGHADQLTPERPPGELVASTPVPMMVMPIAMMMDAKSITENCDLSETRRDSE